MKKKRSKLTPELEEKLLYCMPYLHGDVAGSQFRSACCYEYARESKILIKVAELFRRHRSTDAMEIFFQIEREFPAAGEHLIEHEWRVIWQCPSFPEKSWNDLSEDERSDLLWGLPCLVKPLDFEKVFPIPSLDRWKSMLLPGWNEARAGGRPIVESPGTSLVYAVLPLDFSKSKKRVRREIDDWLKLPDNKARFEKHKPAKEAGTPKEAKDRLKDLAAWRLYRELGRDKANEFAVKHRLLDKHGRPRPFHDARKEPSIPKRPLNETLLFTLQSGDSCFLHVIKRAKAHLAELLPWVGPLKD
jgi:hypothetical protein